MKESLPAFGRSKTNEELQAQIENFAEKKIPSAYNGSGADDIQEFYKKKKEVRAILEAASELSSVKNLDYPSENLSEGSKELIAKHKDSYLESLKKENSAKLKFQTECVSKYNEEFKSIVEDLRFKLSKIKSGEDFDQFGENIKSGMEGHVFKIQTSSGVYAIKLFKQGFTEQQLEAMRRAKDIPNVAHMVAYSQGDRAIVMDFIEGKTLNTISKEEKPNITDNELKSILATCIELYKAGIIIDTQLGKNVIFDGKEFHFIDYHTFAPIGSFKHVINSFSEVISARKKYMYTQEYEADVVDTENRMVRELKRSFSEFYSEHRKDFEKGRFESLKAKIKKLFK